MRTDLLSGVAILIRPLVNDLADQIFDSRVLAERIADAYGISIPPAALEGMTHRLVAANILRIEQLPSGFTRALYNAASDTELLESDAEADFQEILDEFLRHAHERLQAAGKHLSDEALLAGFLRHLATLDFSAIKAKPQVVPEPGKTIVGPGAREQIALSAELAEQAGLDSLVASYISWLQEHRPAQLGLLIKVADGALAAELVFDLQAPTSVAKLTNTTVVVDTPLILSYLDLSSTQDATDARKLFDQIHEAGAKIAAFQHSLEEAEGVLKAIQNARDAGEAYGPSVHRLSNTLFRAYFESMIGSISRCWKQDHNLEVIPKAATHYHKNFPPIDEEELVGAIRLSAFDRVLTRERDAKSVAETMRRLAGAHIPINSVASCNFIFATSNSSLQRRVADFLARKNYVIEGEFNPIVTSRYLAGLCWLICGGKSDQSPTMAKLLANCAAALRLRPEIAERTKRFLAAVDPEKARHFEVLMTNERASQYIIEATLGDINVVTANNAEDIFEEVQRRAAEKVAIEKDQEYQGQIDVLQATILQGKENTEQLRSSLAETMVEAEAQRMEVRNLTLLANEIQTRHVKGLEKLGEQAEQLQELSARAERTNDIANEAHRQLSRQQQMGRDVAKRYADRRVNWIRHFGVLALFLLAFGAGYVDKFISPLFAAQSQSLINYAVIFFQSLLGLLGIGLFFKPLEKLRKRLYEDRLVELGIPEDNSHLESKLQ